MNYDNNIDIYLPLHFLFSGNTHVYCLNHVLRSRPASTDIGSFVLPE